MLCGGLSCDGAPTPIASDDFVVIPTNTPVNIDVSFNDTGSGLAVISATEGSNGGTLVNEDGTVQYFPTLGFTGQDSFSYVTEDGRKLSA